MRDVIGMVLIAIGVLWFLAGMSARSETILQQIYHLEDAHSGLLVAILGGCIMRAK